MFKKVLSRLFGSKRAAPRLASPAASGAGGSSPAPAPAAQKTSGGEKTPDARKKWESAAAKEMDLKAAPEALCGVTPAMSREEVQERLAMLYRRHNRAASSLDAKLREEAEVMLEAIAVLREKHFGRTGKS